MIQTGSAPVALTVLAVQSNAYVYGIAGIVGKPAPGAFVLLPPANPNADRNAWRPTRSTLNSDGSFYLQQVPPGALHRGSYPTRMHARPGAPLGTRKPPGDRSLNPVKVSEAKLDE